LTRPEDFQISSLHSYTAFRYLSVRHLK
jgi:hypothetical protein